MRGHSPATNFANAVSRSCRLRLGLGFGFGFGLGLRLGLENRLEIGFVIRVDFVFVFVPGLEGLES